MENLARSIANKISKKLGYDDEKTAVIAYGLIGLFQFIIILCACALIGLVFGFFWEAMIIFWGAGLLRRVMGGAHSSGFYSCLFISVVCICILAYICSLIKVYSDSFYFLLAYLVIYAAAFVIVYKLAPVESPNKPIKESKRVRLRKKALMTLGIFAILTVAQWIINNLWDFKFYISCALTVSVMWQTFLLLPAGKAFVSAADRIFNAGKHTK